MTIAIIALWTHIKYLTAPSYQFLAYYSELQYINKKALEALRILQKMTTKNINQNTKNYF